jgi:hypothetical protein
MYNQISRGTPSNPNFLILLTHKPYAASLIKQLKLAGANNVDAKDITSIVPDISELIQYDAVLMNTSNAYISNQTALGDVLEKYSDNGGGIVLTVYTNSQDNQAIGGRFLERLHPLTGSKFSHSGLSQTSLGNVLVPHHPVMRGVSKFAGGSYSGHVYCQARPEATLIASWDDGHPLVVEHRNDKSRATIIALNMDICSSTVERTSWSADTDGYLLLHNSLMFVCQIKKEEYFSERMMLSIKNGSFSDLTIIIKQG